MNFLLLVRLFQLTGSAIATSFLWISYALPSLLIGPIAATSVDLIDRRKVLIIANLLQALTILSFALLHEGRLFLLFGVVFLYSFINQFYVTAESATLPDLVDKKFLPQANGLFFLTQEASIIVGFGVAGFLLGFLGFTNALFTCSLLVIFAFISTLFLPKGKYQTLNTKGLEKDFWKFFGRLKEGYDFIKTHKKILMPFFLLMGAQIALSIVIVNIPLFATEIVKVNLNYAGLVIVAPSGLGAIIAALSIPKILGRGVRKKEIIEYSLGFISLIFFVFVFIIPILGSLERIVTSILLVIFTGYFFVGVIIPSQTFLQEATPGGLRGRVFGNFWFLATVASVLPVIFSGAVSELLGIKLLFSLLGGVVLAGLIISKKYGQKIIQAEFGLQSDKIMS